MNKAVIRWIKVKYGLRSSKAKTADTFLSALANALRSISVNDILNWMSLCGYACS
jgi:hypothetical protein